MPFHRTSAFWLGGFIFLFILFGWYDSLQCGRRWSWGRTGKSEIHLQNASGEFRAGYSSVNQSAGPPITRYPVTPLVGKVSHYGRNGRIRFGGLRLENNNFPQRILHGIVYQQHNTRLIVPHWLVALLWLPVWFNVSNWRASIFARKRTEMILATDPRCFAPEIDPTERTEILKW